jgi:hypothetical protein
LRSCDLGRGPKALLRPVTVAGAHLRVAHGEQQVAAGFFVRFGYLEDHLVQPHRLFVGQRRDGAVTRQARVARGRIRVAPLEVVVGELGGVGLGMRRVEPLERLPGPPVGPGAPAGRKLVVERVADERVREPEAPACLGYLDQHVGGYRGVEHLERLIASRLAEAPQGRGRELPPEDRCTHEHVGALLRQVGQALCDHLPDGVRDGRTAALGAAQASLGDQQLDQLVDEERIAVGLAVNRRGQRVGVLDLRRQRDEAGDVELAQAAQRQPASRVVPGELGQRRPQRVVAQQLDVSIRDEDEDLGVRHFAGEELQEQQRRRVCGVQVVEHQPERMRRGRPAQEGRRGVEEPEPRAVGLQRLRRR